MLTSNDQCRANLRRSASRLLLVLFTAGALLGLSGQTLSGQVVLGIRLGHSSGTANYNVGQIFARTELTGPIFAVATLEGIGASWACTGGPLESVRCDYDGFSLSLGLGAALIESERLHVAPVVTAGRFQRVGGVHSGDASLTGTVGINTEFSLFNRVRFQAGLSHRRIFDGLYHRNFDEHPHFTAGMLGLGISLW